MENSKIIPHLQPLTAREKACLAYGYVRHMAEDAKQNGLFPEYSVKEVMSLLIEAYLVEDDPLIALERSSAKEVAAA